MFWRGGEKRDAGSAFFYYLCAASCFITRKTEINMKRVILALLLLLPLTVTAQTKDDDMQKYLAGAVPVNAEGFVYFEKTFDVPGKSRTELFSALKNYVEKEVVGGPDHLEKSRITEADSATGTLAASIEEWLYFAKRAWVTHRTIFYYQLVYEVEDGRFTVSLRNLRYHYVENDTPGVENLYRAEEWITDDEALNKQKTKLTRIAGKFRRFTIDRKDALFQGAARAVGLQ